MDAHMSIAASTTRDASPSVAPTSGRKTDEARRAAKRDPHINSKALLRPRGRSVSGNARVPIQSLRRAAGLRRLLFSANETTKWVGGGGARRPRPERLGFHRKVRGMSGSTYSSALQSCSRDL